MEGEDGRLKASNVLVGCLDSLDKGFIRFLSWGHNQLVALCAMQQAKGKIQKTHAMNVGSSMNPTCAVASCEAREAAFQGQKTGQQQRLGIRACLKMSLIQAVEHVLELPFLLQAILGGRGCLLHGIGIAVKIACVGAHDIGVGGRHIVVVGGVGVGHRWQDRNATVDQNAPS